MAKSDNPFRYFHSSPELIREVVMLYVRFPLSLRNVKDLLSGRGFDLCHETVRLWWNRFGPMFAGEIRRRRVNRMRGFRHWRWHLDEMYVNSRIGAHQLRTRLLRHKPISFAGPRQAVSSLNGVEQRSEWGLLVRTSQGAILGGADVGLVDDDYHRAF